MIYLADIGVCSRDTAPAAIAYLLFGHQQTGRVGDQVQRKYEETGSYADIADPGKPFFYCDTTVFSAQQCGKALLAQHSYENGANNDCQWETKNQAGHQRIGQRIRHAGFEQVSTPVHNGKTEQSILKQPYPYSGKNADKQVNTLVLEADILPITPELARVYLINLGKPEQRFPDRPEIPINEDQ